MNKPKEKECIRCHVIFITTKPKIRKFCSRKCAGEYNAQHRNEEEERKIEELLKRHSTEMDRNDPTYREKISLGLKKHFKEHPEKIMRGEEASKRTAKATKGKYNKDPKSLFELSKRTITKIFKRLNAGCSFKNCGWNECTCEIHHINGKKVENPHGHWNLTYICPNHHRMIHAGKIKKEDLTTLDEYIGDKWKNYYYG